MLSFPFLPSCGDNVLPLLKMTVEHCIVKIIFTKGNALFSLLHFSCLTQSSFKLKAAIRTTTTILLGAKHENVWLSVGSTWPWSQPQPYITTHSCVSSSPSSVG